MSAKLAACEDVPLDWRRTFAITTYLYLRAGEANTLTWNDVDLEHAVVHVHQSANRRTGSVSTTKTDSSRRVPIDAALMPLLRAMHDEGNGAGRVLARRVTDRKLSRPLRRLLRLAGVTRAELFDDDKAARASRKPMTFHDLRATGITWRTIRGDAPMTIMQRAGHSTFSTTQGYIREAENLRAGFGLPFPPLTALYVVVEPASTVESASANAENEAAPAPSEVSSPGFGFVTSKASCGADLAAAAGVTAADAARRRLRSTFSVVASTSVPPS